MRFDGNNYVFVVSREGLQLASGVESLIGKNIIGLQDSTGRYFVQDLYSRSKWRWFC